MQVVQWRRLYFLEKSSLKGYKKAFHYACPYPASGTWQAGQMVFPQHVLCGSPAAGSSMGLGQRALLLLTQASGEAGHLPQGCVSLRPPGLWRGTHGRHLGTLMQAVLWMLGMEIQRPRTALREGRTPLVFRSLDDRVEPHCYRGCSGRPVHWSLWDALRSLPSL